MAPLFSEVDSNKLRHYIQNEQNVICVKFNKDLFNISKFIGRKQSGPGFLAYPGIGYAVIVGLSLFAFQNCHLYSAISTVRYY